jgi:hypothetical protein
MLEARIYALRKKLEGLLADGNGFENVYELSVKLDKLIVRYYREKGGNLNRLT